MNKVKILFVCMGNICRSPTAHGVFRDMVVKADLPELVEIDSAGTHAYHVGEGPDRRAQAAARSRGIDLSDLRARKVVAADFSAFDYIVAMDQDNYHALSGLCPDGQFEKIHLFMDFAPHMRTREVPDPYYGGDSGFDRVFDLVEAASRGLLEEIRQRL
jgi:protein-tyrosine phosphatase